MDKCGIVLFCENIQRQAGVRGEILWNMPNIPFASENITSPQFGEATKNGKMKGSPPTRDGKWQKIKQFCWIERASMCVIPCGIIRCRRKVKGN